MRASRLGIALSVLVWLSGIAGAKSDKPTIQDLVFTPDHLIANLGQKTLFWSAGVTQEEQNQDYKLLQKLGLDQKTQFILLPHDAEPPRRSKYVEAVYPDTLENGRVEGEAEYLVLVGDKGKVLSLYCFSRTYNAFGLSGAMAILNWEYRPAKMGAQKVPVLFKTKIKFKSYR